MTPCAKHPGQCFLHSVEIDGGRSVEVHATGPLTLSQREDVRAYFRAFREGRYGEAEAVYWASQGSNRQEPTR